MLRVLVWMGFFLIAGLFISGPTLAAGGLGESAGHQPGAAVSENLEDQLDRNQVRQLQSLLEERGFQVGEVDGIIGADTRMALSDFQREQGLPRTGELTEETLRALATTPEQQEYFGLSPEFSEKDSDTYHQREPMEGR